MIELDYFFAHSNGNSGHYQLIQFSQNEPWRLVQDGELLGSLEKWNGKWQQLTGNPLSDALLEGICKLIESQHYHQLPEQLLSRWGNVIAEVVTKSDDEYLIICKEAVSFRSFVTIFSKFVATLLKDEWPVRFQLFNADFSEDFELTAQPVKASFIVSAGKIEAGRPATSQCHNLRHDCSNHPIKYHVRGQNKSR